MHLLATAVIPVDQLPALIQDAKIMKKDLAALGTNADGQVHVQYTTGTGQRGDGGRPPAAGYPASVDGAIELELEHIPGFHYYRYIGMGAGGRIVEAEHGASADGIVGKVVDAIADAPYSERGKARPMSDVMLGLPGRKDEPIEALVSRDGEDFSALWDAKDGRALRAPRLTPKGGYFAVRDRTLVYFAPDASGRLTGDLRAARPCHAFDEDVDFVSRVIIGRGTLPVTTTRGKTLFLRIDGIGPTTPAVSAEQVREFETDARFIGTPGGNGTRYLLHESRRGDRRAIRVESIDARHLRSVREAII